jgi:hypothetical protein
MNKPTRPRDPNQLAKSIVDIAIGEVDEPIQVETNLKKRMGGIRGGQARALKLSGDERVKIAKSGAKARWEINETKLN